MVRRKKKSEKKIKLPASMGRRGIDRWDPDYIRQAYHLALLGATDQDIADVFGVTLLTIHNWKRNKEGFLTALKRGKSRADAKVAHAMYKKAIGFKYKDAHVLTNRIKKRDSKGKVIEEYTEPLVVEVDKESLPDTAAGFKWLGARQPDKWSQKTHIEGTVKHDHKLDLSDFSIEELKVLDKLGVGSKDTSNIEDIDHEEL
ncbi:MAG: hypothetical protein ACOC22_01065 [bacterium]